MPHSKDQSNTTPSLEISEISKVVDKPSSTHPSQKAAKIRTSLCSTHSHTGAAAAAIESDLEASQKTGERPKFRLPSAASVVMFAVRPKASLSMLGSESSDALVTSVNEGFLDSVAVVAVVASIACMVLTEGRIVDFATTLTTGFGPYAVFQKRKLADLGGIRGMYAKLRSEKDRFQIENERLKDNVSNLMSKVDRLEETENKLSKRANTKNVDRLVVIMKEYKKVNEQIKAKLRAKVLQTVLRVLIQSDRDNDFKINPNEMEHLIVKMGMVEGVDFREDRFRRNIAKTKDHSIKTIMGIFRNLLDPTIPQEDEIFRIEVVPATMEVLCPYV